jgi:hypothetical protein
MTKRQRQQRKWTDDAYNLWIEHGGRYMLSQCIDKTAPPWATEDDRRETLSIIVAQSQALYESIKGALEA